MRSLFALTLALHLVATGGAGVGDDDRACTQRCPDDDAEGRCAATCVDCACCSHVPVAAISVATKSLSSAEGPRIPAALQAAPPSPEPDDILHVPKPHFA